METPLIFWNCAKTRELVFKKKEENTASIRRASWGCRMAREEVQKAQEARESGKGLQE